MRGNSCKHTHTNTSNQTPQVLASDLSTNPLGKGCYLTNTSPQTLTLKLKPGWGVGSCGGVGTGNPFSTAACFSLLCFCAGPIPILDMLSLSYQNCHGPFPKAALFQKLCSRSYVMFLQNLALVFSLHAVPFPKPSHEVFSKTSLATSGLFAGH